MNTKSIVAIIAGTVATTIIVTAEILKWDISPAATSLLYTIAGFVPGYLMLSPRTSKKVRAAPKPSVSAADTIVVEKASESSENLT